MIRGIYTLTSSVLTRNKELGVISNNMANINTQGFKADQLVATSEFAARLNLAENQSETGIGEIALMVTAEDTRIDFSQGSLQYTGRELDFALADTGFFEIATPEGNVYTRNGSFVVDAEGYLTLPGVGRVQGQTGDIRLYTNDFTVDATGTLQTATGLTQRLAVRDFADYSQLYKREDGMFSSREGAQMQTLTGNTVVWKYLEGSNVAMVDEMTAMMASQRSIQSCSQFIKISDQLLSRVINDVGGV